MASDPYPVPSVSPLDDITEWRDLLLAAIDDALDRDDVWPEGEEAAALGYVQDLKLWVSLNIPPGASAVLDTIHLQDQKSSGTDGGTFTSGAWRTRTLNTEVSDSGGNCTLASNQATLTPGTYMLVASAPGFQVERHQLRWQNVSDGTTVLIGQSEYAYASGDGEPASLDGVFTIAASKTFELQHRCSQTKSASGFGVSTNWGETAVFADVLLLKLA